MTDIISPPVPKPMTPNSIADHSIASSNTNTAKPGTPTSPPSSPQLAQNYYYTAEGHIIDPSSSPPRGPPVSGGGLSSSLPSTPNGNENVVIVTPPRMMLSSPATSTTGGGVIVDDSDLSEIPDENSSISPSLISDSTEEGAHHSLDFQPTLPPLISPTSSELSHQSQSMLRISASAESGSSLNNTGRLGSPPQQPPPQQATDLAATGLSFNSHPVLSNLPDGIPDDDNSEFGCGDYSISDSLTDVEFGDGGQYEQDLNQAHTADTWDGSEPSFVLDGSADGSNEIIIQLPSNILPSSSSAQKERTKTIRFSAQDTVHHFTKDPEEFRDHPVLGKDIDTAELERQTCVGKLRTSIVLFFMPFFYGASINISSLYFLIELKDLYKVEDYTAGLLLAGGYVCQILFASLTRWAPKTFALIGTFIAAMGYLVILMSDANGGITGSTTDTTFGSTMSENSALLFMIGGIATNTNEILGALQLFARAQFRKNVKDIGWNLSNVYLMSKVGEVCGFATGGALYYYEGVDGLALQGCVTLTFQLIALVMFIFLDNVRNPENSKASFWAPRSGGSGGRCCKRLGLDCSLAAARGRRRIFTSSMSKINRSMVKHYPSAIPKSLLRSLLPLCNVGSIVSKTLIWGVSAHVLKDDFQATKLSIGVLFMLAAFVDIIMSALVLTERFNGAFQKVLPSPRNLVLSMVGISMSSLMIAIPSFPVFVIGFILYSICNSGLSIILIEMQGSSTDTWEPTRLQTLRRLFTACALFSLLYLYSLHPRLPLVLAFWMAFMTTVIAGIKIYFHPDDDDEDGFDSETLRKNRYALNAARNGMSTRPEQNLIYTEQVMLGWLIKGKEV